MPDHCDHCKNLRWFFDGRPHEGGDERCPKCNPECRTCWDEMQVEVPWSDDLERGPRYTACPACAAPSEEVCSCRHGKSSHEEGAEECDSCVCLRYTPDRRRATPSESTEGQE